MVHDLRRNQKPALRVPGLAKFHLLYLPVAGTAAGSACRGGARPSRIYLCTYDDLFRL